MTESSVLPGLYFADLMTTVYDQAGEWFFTVVSPSESIRYTQRMTLEMPGATGGAGNAGVETVMITQQSFQTVMIIETPETI